MTFLRVINQLFIFSVSLSHTQTYFVVCSEALCLCFIAIKNMLTRTRIQYIVYNTRHSANVLLYATHMCLLGLVVFAFECNFLLVTAAGSNKPFTQRL